jgi:hypothetical protein
MDIEKHPKQKKVGLFLRRAPLFNYTRASDLLLPLAYLASVILFASAIEVLDRCTVISTALPGIGCP